jgi:TM2 domain-containing membrane protein YozV
MELSTLQETLVESRLANEAPSLMAAYAIWFFTASFGGHRFYLGYTRSAIAMLALLVVGVVTSVFGVGLLLLVVLGAWTLLDAVLIPGMIATRRSEARERIAAEVMRRAA